MKNSLDMETLDVGREKEDNLIATCSKVSFEENPCFDVSFSREDMGETSLKSEGKKVCVDEQTAILKPALPENFDDFWLCAICRDRIIPEEIAQVKGCEHAYCVTCILRWASYKADSWCPQCKHPFSFLLVYKALDGSVHDYMSEESVCLLLRASWFKPVPVETQNAVGEHDDCQYEDDVNEDEDEYYYTSNLRLGNRRWGDNGYVRAGRREARPVGVRQVHQMVCQNEIGSTSSRPNKGKQISTEVIGRRAKRALKREAADKAAATKDQHLS